MMDSVLSLLGVSLVVNWVAQMVSIYRLPESHFRQPTDRVLWFVVVVVLFPIGSVVFPIWNHAYSKRIREDQARLERRSRIAQRVEAARDGK